MRHSETLSQVEEGRRREKNLPRSLSLKINIYQWQAGTLEGEVRPPRNRKSLDSGTVAPSLSSWFMSQCVSFPSATAVNIADLGTQLHGISAHMSELLATAFQATTRRHW